MMERKRKELPRLRYGELAAQNAPVVQINHNVCRPALMK